MKHRLIAALIFPALIANAGCAVVSQQQSTQITTVLTQLGNTLTTDLQQQRLVALAQMTDPAQLTSVLNPQPVTTGSPHAC